MEDEINELELLFQGVDADLQYVKRKLESEFAGNFEFKQGQNNPFKLIKRMKRMQDELGPLKEDITTIMAAKQLLTNVSSTMIQSGQAIGYLQARAAIEPVRVNSNPIYTELESTSSQLTNDFILRMLSAGGYNN